MPSVIYRVAAVGIQAVQASFATIANIAKQTGAQFAKSFADASDRSFNSMKKLGKSIERVFEKYQKITKGVIVGTISKLTKEIFELNKAFNVAENQLVAVTGSMEYATQELNFVKDTANELGIDILALAEGYAKLAAATAGTNIEGEKTQQIFKQMSAVTATLNLDAQRTEGVFRALTQMMNKGTVQSEELRGQLAEHLPGAFEIAAEAMGKTRRELQKMIEDGELVSTEFLPKFAQAISDAFGGPALRKALNTPAAAMTRLRNSLKALGGDVGKNLEPMLKFFIEIADAMINKVEPHLEYISRQMGIMFEKIRNAAIEQGIIEGGTSELDLLAKLKRANNELTDALAARTRAYKKAETGQGALDQFRSSTLFETSRNQDQDEVVQSFQRMIDETKELESIMPGAADTVSASFHRMFGGPEVNADILAAERRVAMVNRTIQQLQREFDTAQTEGVKERSNVIDTGQLADITDGIEKTITELDLEVRQLGKSEVAAAKLANETEYLASKKKILAEQTRVLALAADEEGKVSEDARKKIDEYTKEALDAAVAQKKLADSAAVDKAFYANVKSINEFKIKLKESTQDVNEQILALSAEGEELDRLRADFDHANRTVEINTLITKAAADATKDQKDQLEKLRKELIALSNTQRRSEVDLAGKEAFKEQVESGKELLDVYDPMSAAVKQYHEDLDNLHALLKEHPELASQVITAEKNLKKHFEETVSQIEYEESPFKNLIDAAKEGAGEMEGALSDFFFDPVEVGLDGLYKSFVNVLRRMAADAIAADLMGKLLGTLPGQGPQGASALTGLFQVAGTFLGGLAGGGTSAAGASVATSSALSSTGGNGINAITTTNTNGINAIQFAKGGIANGKAATVPLRAVGTNGFDIKSFAYGGLVDPMKGGVAKSAQMAIFGEGTRPEAVVPLPDGKSIPMSMKNDSLVVPLPSGKSIPVDFDTSKLKDVSMKVEAYAGGGIINSLLKKTRSRKPYLKKFNEKEAVSALNDITKKDKKRKKLPGSVSTDELSPLSEYDFKHRNKYRLPFSNATDELFPLSGFEKVQKQKKKRKYNKGSIGGFLYSANAYENGGIAPSESSNMTAITQIQSSSMGSIPLTKVGKDAYSVKAFSDGGVINPLRIKAIRPTTHGMTSNSGGTIRVNAYGSGGIIDPVKGSIVSSPQLNITGDSQGQKPEAVVPLPNGKSIPVDLKSGQPRGDIYNVNVTVQQEVTRSSGVQVGNDIAQELSRSRRLS